MTKEVKNRISTIEWWECRKRHQKNNLGEETVMENVTDTIHHPWIFYQTGRRGGEK